MLGEWLKQYRACLASPGPEFKFLNCQNKKTSLKDTHYRMNRQPKQEVI
jgi:hypothetical protein